MTRQPVHLMPSPPLPLVSPLESAPPGFLIRLLSPRRHDQNMAKGFSFLSFSSSEDHEHPAPESGNSPTTELVCQDAYATHSNDAKTYHQNAASAYPCHSHSLNTDFTISILKFPTSSTDAHLRALNSFAPPSQKAVTQVLPSQRRLLFSPITRPPSFLAARPVVKSKSQSFLGIAYG